MGELWRSYGQLGSLWDIWGLAIDLPVSGAF